MKKKIIASAICATALALSANNVSASGAIAPVEVAPVVIQNPVTADFEGFYSGIEAGKAIVGTFTNGTLIREECGNTLSDYDCTGSESYNLDGNVAGLFVGYNTSRSGMLLGGELRYMSISGSETTLELAALTTATVSLEDLIDLRGRVGFISNDNLMFYGAVGASRLTIDTSFCFRGSCAGGSESVTGVNAGLGLEYNIGPSIFTGLDYTIRQFDVDGSDADVDTLTLRLGYRF